jgi:integrase
MRGYRLGRYRGKWCAIWHADGRTHRASLGLEASEANRPAAGQAFDEWVADQRRIDASPRGVVTIKHILDGYHNAVPGQAKRMALYSELGPKTPPAVDKTVCETYAKKRARAGIRPSTIHTELGLLRSAFLWAKRAKWIAEAPEVPRPLPSPPRDRWLTPEEAVALINGAGSKHIRLFILLALYTGARRGAILDLTWDRVDLEQRRIDFTAPGRFTGRKRRSEVPIQPGLHSALLEAYSARLSNHVIEFAGQAVKSVKRGFREAVTRARLERVTPHTLRHTAATWAAQEGAPLWEIAGMLGHTTTEITQKVYAKHHPDFLRQAAGAIESRLNSARPVPANRTGVNKPRKQPLHSARSRARGGQKQRD